MENDEWYQQSWQGEVVMSKEKCIACGKFMPDYAVQHRTFGNHTVVCHTDCEPTEDQLWRI